MAGPDQVQSLFDAELRESADGYHLEVPDAEVGGDAVEAGEVYRVALLEPSGEQAGPDRREESAPEQPQPPVERGEIRYVEIEDLGKQGDGIARVERGYVIIVPGGEVGDRQKVEIAEVAPNFAVGEIVEETFD